jgi:hypothetical protein
MITTQGKGVMNKAMEIAAVAVCLALSPAGLASAHPRRASRPRQAFSGGNDAFAPALARNAIGAQQTAGVIPDWTVQYGVVTNPRGSSGSFGAMLEGKNPAANAVP